MALLAKSAVDEFRKRVLDNWDWLKDAKRSDFEAFFNGLLPAPRFKTRPYLHQLAAFFVGISRDRFLYLLDMGTGKAQPLTAKVLTPDGWKLMGQIQAGDLVCSPDGGTARVVRVWPQGIKPIYRVTFNDGASTECCTEHLWRVSRPSNNRDTPRWVTQALGELAGDLEYPNGNRKWKIPVTRPVDFSGPGPVELDGWRLCPYLLGVILGDGSLSQPGVRVTSSYPEIVQAVMERLPPEVTAKQYGIDYTLTASRGGRNRLNEAIKLLGLAGTKSRTKFIPERYKYASVADRLLLLQGLLDTDGYIEASGSVSYCSMSPRLLRDVQELVWSLGGTARITRDDLTINLPTSVPPFSFSLKKLERVSTVRKYLPARYMKSVKLVGEKEAACIQLDSASGLYITDDYLVTHNTKIILDVLDYRIGWGDAKRALVLVPNVVNIETWMREASTHSDFLRCVGLYGSRNERWRVLDGPDIDGTHVVVVNYAGLLSLACKSEKRGGMTVDPDAMTRLRELFDVLVLDESQAVKNRSSLTYKIVSALAKTCPIRFAMTGTPHGRDPQDLWAQFHVVDDGETLGKTLTLFRAAFFTSKPGYWGGFDYKLDRKQEQNLARTLKNRSIRYRADECVDLPKLVTSTIRVSLAQDAEGYYRSVVKEVRAAKGNYREMENVFVRMRQISSGFLAMKDEEDERIEIEFPENPKLDALMDLVDALPEDRKMVVFHEFIHSGAIISKALTARKVKHVRLYGATKDKTGTLTKFLDDPTVRILVVNSASGGTGLNLQVANYVAFFESPVSPIVRQQAERRCYRAGQTRSVFMYDLVTRGTLDEKVLSYLDEGRDLLKALVEGVEDVDVGRATDGSRGQGGRRTSHDRSVRRRERGST